MDIVAIYELHGGDGDGADIIFSFNNKMISLSISPSNGSSAKSTQHLGPDRSLQDHLIDAISEATTCENGEKYEKIVDEILGVILEAGMPLFSGLISTTEKRQSLHDLIFPVINCFRLEAPAGNASIFPIDPSKTNSILTPDPVLDQSQDQELKIREDLPRFTPDEITVTEILVHGANSTTATVRVNGRDMFCKAHACSRGLSESEEERELEYLGEISKAFPYPGTIQVPEILGYVHHKETKQILGYLQQWVPGPTLSSVELTGGNGQKWMLQISQTVDRLHEHGLFWGNGKPGSVIIDDKDDIWLIGCGRGFMHDLVDEDMIERDKKALINIADFLGRDSGVTLSG